MQLEDNISNYLSNDIIDGLHVLNGMDHSNEIMIQHLISNTSGTADYFLPKQANGIAGGSNLFNGKDEAWSLEKTLDNIKQIKPQFKPGKKAS
ncbi:hypothetical protein ACFFF5_16195 [Lederbergia wuyishanensis]|uniref:CubicO group peptidase (Beta-lactamase class C family) n=1 Tax=Lederbergia wuyishanensis TaxID=1347903 RepID=A0ABU0D5X6_9BACI|nr:hypothetical protein [Lederbergia wuyishanensis]MCJ8008355.1 hypothetical protein [Lederbergia wuyishanensis]MDQ0343768.1 CubicO group peptidase (beta-lactamase class C family) [Lederbergia wuyishanensis]